MDDLRIGLVQMRSEKGAIEQNLAAMRSYVEQATARGVDVLCFPEASITGYIDPARYADAVIGLDHPAIEQAVAWTDQIDLALIAGLIERNGSDRPLITQIVARGGKLIGVYRKQTIPDDERALFTAGDGGAVVALPQATFGISVCADIDDPGVFRRHAQRGAAIVFEAAAPGLYGEQATRDWRSGYNWWRGECETKLGQYARRNGVWIAAATQAGRTFDEDFPGGGYIFDPTGARVAATPDWRACVLYAAITDRGTVANVDVVVTPDTRSPAPVT